MLTQVTQIFYLCTLVANYWGKHPSNQHFMVCTEQRHTCCTTYNPSALFYQIGVAKVRGVCVTLGFNSSHTNFLFMHTGCKLLRETSKQSAFYGVHTATPHMLHYILPICSILPEWCRSGQGGVCVTLHFYQGPHQLIVASVLLFWNLDSTSMFCLFPYVSVEKIPQF